MCRFPLVHPFGTALIDDPLSVAHDAIVMLCAHRLQQFQTGDACRPCPVQHNPAIANLFARQFQRVDEASRTDHRRAVLVIMEDRDVHDLFQALFNDETFRSLDVFKVDTTKGRPHQGNRLDDLIRVFGVQFDIDRVHIGKTLEQDRLALHHRLGGQRAKVAHPQNCGPV